VPFSLVEVFWFALPTQTTPVLMPAQKGTMFASVPKGTVRGALLATVFMSATRLKLDARALKLT
jgi:hypothetical protein